MTTPAVTAPAPHYSDLYLAARWAQLANQTGGCLGERTKRSAEMSSLVAEQDRRKLEAWWALPVEVPER